jgi:hypothetical protein
VKSSRHDGVACLASLFFFVILFALSPCSVLADKPPSQEYRLKAAFLFNFAEFAEWPASSFPDADSPLIIGLLGEDPFGSYLDETIRGEKINGRPLIIQRYHSVAEVQSCHILFISQSEALRLTLLFASLKSRNILTVSDTGDFARRGGMIQLATENNKIRLKINLDSTKAARLVLSSKLLRSAEIVNGKS